MILAGYVPTLVIARMLTEFTSGGRPSWHNLMPYLLAFGGVWLGGEALWRLALHFLNRTDARGMQMLYTRGMDDLLKKDLAFFHENFAGSLTKKVIGHAARHGR